MKKIILFSFLICFATISPLFSAPEKNNLIEQFESALYNVMANFESVHDGEKDSTRKKIFEKDLNELQTVSKSLQNAVDAFDIGTDIAPANHVRQLVSLYNVPDSLSQTEQENSSKNTPQNVKSIFSNKNQAQNERNLANRVGITFRTLCNDIQVLKELAWEEKNGTLNLTKKCRQMLPYYELQRNYIFYRMNYSNFHSLNGDRNWTVEMETRLLRMKKIAQTNQAVFSAFYPEESKNINLSQDVAKMSNAFYEILKNNSDAQKSQLMSTILDNSKVTNKNDSKSLLSSLANEKSSQKKTTSGVDDSSTLDYDRKVQEAFSDFLAFFNLMEQIDWTKNDFSNEKRQTTKNLKKDAAPSQSTMKKTSDRKSVV